MTTYIALFLGIKVGGKNILPMKHIVIILEDFVCFQVKTYLQSGNVIFKTDENTRKSLAEKISQSIEKQFKFKPKVLMLEATELEEAINNNPFPTENGKTLHFSFLESIPESQI